MAQRWFQKAGVQAAIVGGLALLIVTILPIALQVPKLRDRVSQLESETSAKDREIQRLETLLTPFRTIALERYTGPESEALRKLATDMKSIQQDLETKGDTIKSLNAQVQTLDPYKQPIRTASAVVEVHVDADAGPGAFIDGTMNASLGFAKANRPLLVLRNRDAQWTTKKIGDGEWALLFEAQKNPTESFGDWTLESLSAADQLVICFNRVPTNHMVVGGSVVCTFNGNILKSFPIPQQPSGIYVTANIPTGSLTSASQVQTNPLGNK
jgi:hypothetical protein